MRKQNNKEVIAILTADIHLSTKVPPWKSAEENWFDAMKRPLGELRGLQLKYECPILCAGDIFDRWNSSPELINFALEYLPDNMYCIPGQHDLPNHNYGEIERSAYWTLVKAGKIRNIPFDMRIHIEDSKKGSIAITGFPFGSKLISLPSYAKKDKTLQIALIHEYKWIKGKSYPNAPIESKLTSSILQYGYDVIVYGDNHNGWLFANMEGTTIFNCGCLMRRKSDEKHYKPQVGLLLESGRVQSHFLDISKDKYLDSIDDSAAIEELDIEEFLEELKKLGDTSLEFTAAIKRFFQKHKTHPTVQKILLKAGEE